LEQVAITYLRVWEGLIMLVNWNMKHFILQTFGSQVGFSRVTGIPKLRISKLIHNRAKVTADEKRIISQKLGVEPSELFSE
jgi:plasmid maintenance system antidote protein VapI